LAQNQKFGRKFEPKFESKRKRTQKNKETRRPPPAPATPGQFFLAQAVTNEALIPYLCVFFLELSILDVLDVESVQIPLYERVI